MKSKPIVSIVVRAQASRPASRELAEIAFHLAIDVHRTMAPLIYPSHTVSIACIYLATFLDPQHPHSKPPLPIEEEWPEDMTQLDSSWATHYASEIEHLEGEESPVIQVLSYRRVTSRRLHVAGCFDCPGSQCNSSAPLQIGQIPL
jgi:hypothetical protein